MGQRIGVFGGSFDPVHYGHLLMAESCREQSKLDSVRFVPTAVSPHKLDSSPASPVDRIEMLKLAMGGQREFEISRIEIDRGGISYTVDTLTAMQAESPEATFFLLLGGDALEEFALWRSPGRICELSILTVVRRPNSAPPDVSRLAGIIPPDRLKLIRRHMVSMPQVDISSTEIRQRVREGRSIRYQVPRAVEKYIQAQGLYQTSSCSRGTTDAERTS